MILYSYLKVCWEMWDVSVANCCRSDHVQTRTLPEHWSWRQSSDARLSLSKK